MIIQSVIEKLVKLGLNELFNILSISIFENKKSLFYFQIGITNSDQFHKLPELPINRTVYKITSSTSACQSAWIAWNSSPDIRDIQYCIILIRLEKRNQFNANNPFASNICDTIAPVIDHPNFSQMHCFPSNRIDVEKFQLTNLTVDCRYLIHVFVRLNGNSLYYDMLEIMTNRYCINEIIDDDTNTSDLDIDSLPHTRMI